MIINQRVWWDGLGAISHGLFSLLALRHPALAEAENIDIDHAVVLNLSCRMCTSYSPMKGSEKSTKSWRGPDPILMDHAPEGDEDWLSGEAPKELSCPYLSLMMMMMMMIRWLWWWWWFLLRYDEIWWDEMRWDDDCPRQDDTDRFEEFWKRDASHGGW